MPEEFVRSYNLELNKDLFVLVWIQSTTLGVKHINKLLFSTTTTKKKEY